ncbi:MAG: hypothetical protein E7262_01860 [Lachnospiraceae bacterium]|nr:hypothetical protein [Lachnospiraceae bacterium]
MKKIISIILSMAIVSAITINYQVDSYAEVVKKSSKDVKATVVGDADGPDVFSVDVTWGAMNFTYMKIADTEWNSETHMFDKTGTFTYKWVASGNLVTVVNHSNMAVQADLSYESEPEYDYIAGKFSDSSVIKLPSAFGKEKSAKSLKASRMLRLSGHLKADLKEYVDIGKIKVEIN